MSPKTEAQVLCRGFYLLSHFVEIYIRLDKYFRNGLPCHSHSVFLAQFGDESRSMIMNLGTYTLHGCGKWLWKMISWPPESPDRTCLATPEMPSPERSSMRSALAYPGFRCTIALKRTKEVLTRNTWEELTPGSLKFFSDTRQHKLNLYGTEVEVRIRQVFFWIFCGFHAKIRSNDAGIPTSILWSWLSSGKQRSLQVDYRGDEVSVENFLRLLTGTARSVGENSMVQEVHLESIQYTFRTDINHFYFNQTWSLLAQMP